MTNRNLNSYDRDRLANMDIKRATHATMSIIDSIQDLTSEEQITGICATFILLADRLNIEPQDCFVLTKNLMNGADGKVSEFRGVQMYMEKELS